MSLIATNKYTVIAGLGLTGLSIVRYLLERGQRIVVWDSRSHPPNLAVFKAQYPDVALALGSNDPDLFLHAEEIIISPGLSRKTPVIQQAITAGVSVVGDVELFARVVNAPVIAITGSNGKSTVTQLVGNMAQTAGKRVVVAGNIGLPVLDALHDDVDLYVLELSSFQLESTQSLKPIAATILNVSEDHMDRYSSFIEYALTKQRIAFGAKTIVVNKQEPLTEPPMADGVKRVCFTAGQPDLKDYGYRDGYIVKGFKDLVASNALKIVGHHNMMNACAALALADAAGLEMETCLDALKAFTGLSHRCEFVARYNEVMFINDSKATNVGATVAAIKGLSMGPASAPIKNIHLILGGDGKGADFTSLLPVLRQHVKSVAVVGKEGPALQSLIANSIPELLVIPASTMADAAEQLNRQASAGETVLLSPACASLDMFSNFEQRGDVFKKAVNELKS